MKSLLTRIFFGLILLSSLTIPSRILAQATINADELKAQMIKDWERAKAYTLSYLNVMPADKYSFKATDSIRSFAQQMLHLAQANVNFLFIATGEPKIFPGENLEASAGAQTRDSVLYYVTKSYDYAIDAIKKLDASKLGEPSEPGPNQLTRITWINKAFEHQTHHRGQTTIYIRLAG
ncbi:MAG: DinB family protein, partial [Chitinophagales bacterium]